VFEPEEVIEPKAFRDSVHDIDGNAARWGLPQIRRFRYIASRAER